jgi:plasmid stabilization system protein ParE
MSLPVVYLADAKDDIQAVHEHYEQDQAGLGDRFAAAVQAVIARIAANPRMYAVYRRDIRAVKLHRFPHVVYYRIRTSDVLVIAVQHGRRSSRGWRDRI